MYPKIEPITGNIELVENSGVQFVDYDAMVNWDDEDKLSHINAIKKSKFFIDKSSDTLVRYAHKISSTVEHFDPTIGANKIVEYGSHEDEFDIKLQDSLQLFDGVWFPIPYLNEVLNGNSYGPTNWARARIVKINPKEIDPEVIKNYLKSKGLAQEALQGVQYGDDDFDDLSSDDDVTDYQAPVAAPQRKLELPKNTDYYRIVLAFDTKSQEFDKGYVYFSPTDRDINSQTAFIFSYNDERSINFLRPMNGGKDWVNEWAGKVFSDLYDERIDNKANAQKIENLMLSRKEHQAHYLNLLAFLGYIVKPAPVKFIARNNSKNAVDVSLILDIGNARSCGIMVEQSNSSNAGEAKFSDTYPLLLRDLNAPERVYNESFASRIEFAEPNFEYDNLSSRSGSTNAFEWPSLVRVGQEASKLAALKSGNEGNTGLIAPKRYLWSTDPFSKECWRFNCYSYQIKSKKLRKEQKKKQSQPNRARLGGSVGMYFNTYGRAYFALDKNDLMLDNLDSRYSHNSTMTFMLIEIFLHALTQMNSMAQRNKTTSKSVPRQLKSIILTTPPCLSIEEKELYRACVYEALGILWKSMGFDKTKDPMSFDCYTESQLTLLKAENLINQPLIDPPVPEVHMDWDEAESGQVVYIYNESQYSFHGHGDSFIKYLRRPMTGQRIGEKLTDSENNELNSARIASLDIGGGTTDLVIKDYSFKKNASYSSSDIIPHDIFKDGFKIAGDDILHDIIKYCIINRLAYPFAKRRIQYKPILNELVGDSNTSDAATEMLRSQFTQQILVKIAYKIMFHLEHLDPYLDSYKVRGTVEDFILDREYVWDEKNQQPLKVLPNNIKRPGRFDLPTKEVIDFVNDVMSRGLPNFSIMDFKFSFDIAKINRAILEGSRFDICRILSKLCEVITTYNVDLLLLTGRASKIPAIRSFFLQRLNVPSSRIIAMHSYRCESWYPFLQDGEFIGDPKTTAAVGALISYLRLDHKNFPSFRYNAKPSLKANGAHYVGILDKNNKVSDSAVLYKYESAVLLSHKDASQGKRVDAENKEGNFTNYNRKEDAFNTVLSVELGYRLLDDPDVECNPLYKIEAYDDIEDVDAIKQARHISFNGTGPQDIELLAEQLVEPVRKEFLDKIAAVNEQVMSNNSQQVKAREQKIVELENSFALQAQEYVAAQNVEASVKGGLFGFGKDNKIAEAKTRLYNEYVAAYKGNFMQEELSKFDSEYNRAQATYISQHLEDIFNDAIDANLSYLRSKFAKDKAELDELLQNRHNFTVTLSTVLGNKSPYPVPFLKKTLPGHDNINIVPGLPTVETFKLESVMSENGKEYVQLFRMYLKSIAGDQIEYFMDSGHISTKGLNPRMVL